MAHELTFRHGRVEMFYYGDTPWHGLGVQVDKALTSFEAIKMAGLDWLVGKDTLMRKMMQNQNVFVPSSAYYTYRMDTGEELGIVGKNYKIIQNHECFSFLDTLTQTVEAKYHSAGSLKGGKRVWMLLKLPNTIKVIKDDIVDKYLLLVNGHDGKISVKIMFTPIRVVCMNTLMSAIKHAQVYISIKHNGKLESRIKEARETLGFATKYFDEMEAVYKRFAETSISDTELNNYYEKLFNNLVEKEDKKEKKEELTEKKDNIKDYLKRLYFEGAGHEYSVGTLWGAYNSVIEYVDHHRTNYETVPDKYLNSLLFGAGLKIKTQAFVDAYALIEN